MSIAREVIHDYDRRTRGPGAHNNDPWFLYQTSVLRDLLGRLEMILEDEGVAEDTIRRVIRCVLYGSPHTSDAELRAEQQEMMATALQFRPVEVMAHIDSLPYDVRQFIEPG